MSTPVVIESGKRPLYRKFVRDGVAGNFQVVYEMIREIRNDVDYDKGVEDQAKRILIDAGLSSYSQPKQQLRAVFEFVKQHIIYIQDLAGRIESLKDARATLRDGYGDCDDQAVLNATLLGCLGFEDVKIAMAKYAPDDTTFGHVYCVVYTSDGKRYVMDTTLPNAKFNEEVKAYEVKEIAVFQDDVTGGFSGAYNNVRHHARKLARFTVRSVPSAVCVLPMGFVAANALATGAQMIDQSTGQGALSIPATASNINTELDKIILDLLSSKIAYDLAKTQALQLAAQLAAVERNQDDAYTINVVGASIKSKLDFINNFPAYSKANNIKLVYLDSTKMLCAGIILAVGTGYVLYKGYKNRREFV